MHHGGGDANLTDLGDSIDSETFSQMLEMDASEDDREFSQSIVFGFFEQAEETFEKMDEALCVRPIPKACQGEGRSSSCDHHHKPSSLSALDQNKP